MKLMRDITEFKTLVSRFSCPIVTEKFEILRYVCWLLRCSVVKPAHWHARAHTRARDAANIFIVPESNLETLAADSSLAKLEQSDLTELLALREALKNGTTPAAASASIMHRPFIPASLFGVWQ